MTPVKQDIDVIQDQNSLVQQISIQSQQQHSDDSNSQLENQSPKPAQQDTKADQTQQPANFKTLWSNVINDQEVPTNLRTSWDANEPVKEPAKPKSSAANRPKM